jgi:hypothetical protein
VDPEVITAVRMEGPEAGEVVELTPDGPAWTVNGFRADSAGVARFWEAVGGTSVEDLVGTNPDNHLRLGVNADSAWSLDLVLPNERRTLLVGKSGTRYGTAYVRLPDHDEVYLMEGGLRPTMTRSLDDWRSKRVARVDTAAVQRIELDRE